MKKRTLYIILLILIILIILFIVFRDKLFPARCNDGSFAKDGKCGDKQATNEKKENNTDPVTNVNGIGCTQPSAYTTLLETATPPFAIGEQGDQIKRVQRGLGITADGYFGCQTQEALMKKHNSKVITQQIYNQYA